MKVKGEHGFLKRTVLFCICFILLYTVFNVYINYRVGLEINPTLTTCVYSFFGTELGLCALTRILENFKRDNDDNNTTE